MDAAYTLGCIGAGNMAEAIVRGLLNNDTLSANDIFVADLAEDRRALFANQLGIAATDDPSAVAAACSILILAVKPQQMDNCLATIAPSVSPDTLVISIAAGLSTSYFEAALGEPTRRVVRVMPNTPMLVGDGMAVLCAGSCATEDDVDRAQTLFAASADTLVVEEAHMDAVTAVSGSGPAYVFYLVEAMLRGGVEAGLSEQQATHLATVTCRGAAALLCNSDDSPETLRRKVTSPGGTTEAAINTMDTAGVNRAIRQAIQAAADRSRQLGR